MHGMCNLFFPHSAFQGAFACPAAGQQETAETGGWDGGGWGGQKQEGKCPETA